MKQLLLLVGATAIGAACISPDRATDARPANRPIGSLNIRPAVDTAGVGQTARFAVGDSLPPFASWTVSDSTIARIVQQGGGQVSLLALRPGTATVTAARDEESGAATLVVLSYAPDTVVATVRVRNELTRVPVGDTARFGVDVSDAYRNTLLDRPMTVTLSDSSIARRVNGEYPHDLRLVALKYGTTTVTVTVEGKSDCAQLLVADSMPDLPTLCAARKPVASGWLIPSTVTGEVGDSQYYHAWLYEAQGILLTNRIATWSVGDTTIAQIRPIKNEGSILPMAIAYLRRAGTTTLVVTSEGINIFATITVR